MGRRSKHTPDELRELILGATRRVIEESGFQHLSAREIARAIGYAPGTLYNMFQNLDEILLRVQSRVLHELDDAIADAMVGKKGVEAIHYFASAYVEFAYANPRLWQLLIEHHPTSRVAGPDWYLDSLYAPLARLEPALGKLNGTNDAEEAARTARLIWASVHGILQVATTTKYGPLPKATAVAMAEGLVSQYIAGSMSASLPPRREPRREDPDAKRERHPR